MRNLALLVQVLDEALRILPPTVPKFTEIKIYAVPLLSVPQRKRVVKE